MFFFVGLLFPPIVPFLSCVSLPRKSGINLYWPIEVYRVNVILEMYVFYLESQNLQDPKYGFLKS